MYLFLLFSYIPMFTNCFYQNVFVLNEACFPDAGSLDRVGAVLCMQPDGRSASYHCHYRRCGQSGYKDLIKHFLGTKHLRQISCSVRLSLLPMSDKTFSPLIAFCSSEHFLTHSCISLKSDPRSVTRIEKVFCRVGFASLYTCSKSL